MERGLASAALFIVIALVGYSVLLRLEVYMALCEEVFGSFVTVSIYVPSYLVFLLYAVEEFLIDDHIFLETLYKEKSGSKIRTSTGIRTQESLITRP